MTAIGDVYANIEGEGWVYQCNIGGPAGSNAGPVVPLASGYTFVAADSGSVFVGNGPASGPTLPNPAPSEPWSVTVVNINATPLVVAPAAGVTLNGTSSSLSIPQNGAAIFWTDGTNYYYDAGGGGGSGGSTLVPSSVVTADPNPASVGTLVLCNTTSGSFSVTFPNAPADKSQVGVLIYTLGTGHSITVQRNGSGTDRILTGSGLATSDTIVYEGQLRVWQYDASLGVWLPIAANLPLAGLDLRYLLLSTYDPAAIAQQVVGTTATQTLTNKRFNPRGPGGSTGGGSETINSDTTDLYAINGLTANLTLANPSGTPVDGQRLLVRIADNGNVWTIAYGTQFKSRGGTLPTSTSGTSTVYTYIQLIWNANASTWDCVGVAQG